MGHSLYLHGHEVVFGGRVKGPGTRIFKLIGIPLEMTVSYKRGTCLAPLKIREASLSIESFSLRHRVDFDGLGVQDLGDIETVPGDLQKTLNRVNDVLAEIVEKGDILLLVGGEHTITYAGIKFLSELYPETDLIMIIFDAHLDMRDEFPLGVKMSHATVMRRVLESMPATLIFLGTRAVAKEEVEYAESRENVFFFEPERMEEGLSFIKSTLSKGGQYAIYVSIDLDVFDPSIAPGVGNPEPGGLSLEAFWKALNAIIESPDVKALDITECTPLFDVNDITSILAAKIIYEFVCGYWAYHFSK